MPDRALQAPVPLGIGARDRSGQPGPRKQLGRPLDDHERSTQGLVLAFDRQRLVGFTAVGTGAAQEDARPDVSPLEGLWVLPRQLAPQRHQAARVVAVMMAQDDLGHAAQVDLQLARIVQHGLGPSARVEQDAMAVGHHQGRKTPLADPGPVGQHRRENHDLERLDPRSRGLGR